MKISTITCHHVYNYGATLQAYALQKHLTSMGYDYEIINYIPWYHNRYCFWSVNRFSSHYNLINRNIPLKLLWCLKYNLPNILREYKRKKAFDKFDSKYLNISKTKYSSIEELRKSPPQADVYICGSDQIWNQNATNGIEKAYYLDFGDTDTYRMSYAPSFGSDSLPDNKAEIAKLLHNIDTLSVREKSGKEILNELGFPDTEVVVDPAFLLDKTQWKDLSVNAKAIKRPSKYILLYNFKDNNKIRDFISKLKETLKIPIVCIHGYDNITYADITVKDAGPSEFINLIEHAEAVVSDSFHATVFSIIFNREFYTFSLNGQNNTARMKNLLETLGITKRLNPENPDSDMIVYSSVMNRLASIIHSSKQYLKSAILG